MKIYLGSLPTSSIELIDEAPPAPPKPVLIRNPLNLTRVTGMNRHFVPGWRYYRSQAAVVFTTDVIDEPIACTDVSVGGAIVTLDQCVRYDLRVGTTTYASVSPPAGAKSARLAGNWGTLADGAIQVDLWGIMSDGTSGILMSCGAYLDRKGLAKDDPRTWSQSSSFDYVHGNPSNDVVLMTKVQATPKARPLPARLSFKSFNNVVLASKIVRRMLLPGPLANNPDLHYPLVMKSGITVLDNNQKYGQSGMFEKHPRFPIIEGPRGVAQLPYPLFVYNGRNNKTYVVGNAYLAVIDSTGDTKVLAGYSHKAGVHFNEPPTSVLDPRYVQHGVFDPAIPVEQRIFDEPWGFAFVPRSLELDMSAPLVGGEPPHKTYTTADGRFISGPLALMTDKSGCIWGIQFDAADRSKPPYIYHFLPPGTLQDGWKLVTDGDLMWVTERTGQRVSEWNTDTRQKIRDVVYSPAAALEGYIAAAPQRKFFANVGRTVTTARVHDVCFPEGIDKFVDPATGKLWLYVASTAQQQVNRYCPATGEIEKGLCFPTYNQGGVGFYHSTLSVSDGTVGPAGTIFHTTFLTTGFGQPDAFLPEGVLLADGKTLSTKGQHWGWFNYQFGSSNYAIAVSANNGRITSCDGVGNIDQHHLFESGIDPVIDWVKVQNGFTEFVRRGYPVIYGPNCCSMGDIPLPWGEDPNMDVYMRDFLGL